SNFFRRVHSTNTANHELFATRVNDPTSGILDILSNDSREVVNGETGIAYLVDLRLDDDLLDEPTVSIDLRHTSHSTQLRFDDVFLELPELHQLRFTRGRRIGCVHGVVERVIENFAEAGRNRYELRRQSGWQRISCASQTLGHKLTRTINIGLVGELQRDLRQAEPRKRSHLGYTSETAERHFQRHRHQFLNF